MSSPEYLNDHEGAVRQTIAIKSPTIHQNYESKQNYEVEVSRIRKPKGNFVVFAPFASHAKFSIGCHVARATNFADFSWADVGKVVSKNMKRFIFISNALF